MVVGSKLPWFARVAFSAFQNLVLELQAAYSTESGRTMDNGGLVHPSTQTRYLIKHLQKYRLVILYYYL